MHVRMLANFLLPLVAFALFAMPLVDSLGNCPAEAGQLISNSIGMRLSAIPASMFTMGSPADERWRQEEERTHEVRITRGFWMSVTEVTQKQWLAVMEHNPSEQQGEDLPVERVSWREANDFCGKLSTKEGRRYRLPTEAEWEYACRAGETGAFSGSRSVQDAGWCSLNSTSTKAVATLKPNAWGLFDMHGNVAEWCSDRYGPYASETVIDPVGPAEGGSRVVRGGSWRNFAAATRCAARSSAPESYQFPHVGFRVVLEAE